MFQPPLLVLRSPVFIILPFLTFIAVMSVSSVKAAAIGLPTSTMKLGVGTKIMHVSVNDDIGNTENILTTQSRSIYLTDWLNKGSRYLAEVYLASYAFNADSNHLGQSVSQNGVRFTVQFSGPENRFISPWFGVGVDASYSYFRRRHLVDEDGYLVSRFDDAKKPGLGLLFNVMENWSVTSNFDIAAKLEYSVPINQTVNGFSAGLIFLFRPPQ